jgi:hypothetical protein
MSIEYENLTQEKFREMGYRETIRGVPAPLLKEKTENLTKTQILTLIMINNHSTRGFGQIRDYGSWTIGNGIYIPSESVPKTLDEKGYVDVERKKTVSRRTGRTESGFEKKKEGGYVNCYTSDDVLDGIAQKLGFDNRFSDGLCELAKELLKKHPQK